MATYNDGYREELNAQVGPTEPQSSSSRTARIRAFLESSSHSPLPSIQQQIPLPNNPRSLLTNILPLLSSDTSNSGLPPSFLDTLDRVDKKSIKKDDICPICTTPYLEDQYPLVVKLRCGHKFDLECIGVWLKEHSNCPMCRQGVQKRKPVVIPDDETEYDDTYS